MSSPRGARAEQGRPGPGRPSSGARERLLAAGLEVLKAEGYAGLTTAKVAARAGENKALIGYHFGSKQGLVAAVARQVSDDITEEVLHGLESTESVEQVVGGMLAGLWRVMDRDERLARLYFDLAAVSVVEADVREVMREMKTGWRDVIVELLSAAADGPPRKDAEAAAVYVMAGAEGLALERLDRGETGALERARRMFVRGASAVIGSS